jgi:hypothetical protein
MVTWEKGQPTSTRCFFSACVIFFIQVLTTIGRGSFSFYLSLGKQCHSMSFMLLASILSYIMLARRGAQLVIYHRGFHL